jgi:hypothetical protein
MASNIFPFQTKDDVTRFAEKFVQGRVDDFKKDIDICLTANARGVHAYMPALMATIAHIDYLSGLNAGDVEGHDVDDLVWFVQEHMPGRYLEHELRVLYVAFRHKLAHLSQPYFVFDTASEPKRLKGCQPMLLTWTITDEAHEPPLRIDRIDPPQVLVQTFCPWETPYDHRMFISIGTLAADAIHLSAAYLGKLRRDPELWMKFKGCMKEFYQLRP